MHRFSLTAKTGGGTETQREIKPVSSQELAPSLQLEVGILKTQKEDGLGEEVYDGLFICTQPVLS
jgi:hypothetical protein